MYHYYLISNIPYIGHAWEYCNTMYTLQILRNHFMSPVQAPPPPPPPSSPLSTHLSGVHFATRYQLTCSMQTPNCTNLTKTCYIYIVLGIMDSNHYQVIFTMPYHGRYRVGPAIS